VGLGVAMLFVPTMKVLAEWFAASEFALMTGILMAMGGVGSLTATVPLALLSAWIGWRYSFVFVGGLTLVLAVLVWLIVRDRPSDMGLPSPSAMASGPAEPIPLGSAIRRVVASPYFWPVAVWFFFDCGVFFAFGGLWGGPYLMQVYGLSKSQAGRILSMIAVGMVVGSPFLSFLSSNVFRARKPVIVLCSVVVLGLTALLAFYTSRISIWGLYLVCLGLGIFASAVVVIGFTTNKELFPVQMAGTATGLVNLFPFAGGAVFQPVLGYVLERTGRAGDAFTLAGYQNAFWVLFLCAVVALLASLFMKETMARQPS